MLDDVIPTPALAGALAVWSRERSEGQFKELKGKASMAKHIY